MKSFRQEKIIEIINKYEIATQKELTEYLKKEGLNTTQATVSRDIKALALKKMPGEKGQKYVYFEKSSEDKGKYLRIFRDGTLKVMDAGNIVVIKTISGTAMAVAAALDELNMEEIVGSIAGDDTIMCACRTEEKALELIHKISELVKLK